MAAEASHTAEGHNVEFKTLEARTVLNRSVLSRQPSLAYSINPYRGCELACRYCYARYTHEFLAARVPVADAPDFRDRNFFERLIFLKENATWLLEQELRKIDPTDEFALGTATDPYQPIERTAGVTRPLQEVFSRKEGNRLGIITKSKLIEARYRFADENSAALHAVPARDGHNARHRAGPTTGATRATARSSFPSCTEIARSRPDGGDPVLAAAARHYRYGRGVRRHCGARPQKRAPPFLLHTLCFSSRAHVLHF